MTAVRFTAKIEIVGVNPYVLVSKERASQIKEGYRKPIPVLVRVNSKPDQPWHINMMPVGDGSFYLYLHGDVRKASNTAVGDLVDIEVTFDQDYHNGPLTDLPDWFKAAIEQNISAKQNWSTLPPSRQKEVVRYLVHLKSQGAKQRNLEKVITMLSGEAGRFMGRDWKNGK